MQKRLCTLAVLVGLKSDSKVSVENNLFVVSTYFSDSTICFFSNLQKQFKRDAKTIGTFAPCLLAICTQKSKDYSTVTISDREQTTQINKDIAPNSTLNRSWMVRIDITNQNVQSLQQRHGKSQSPVRWWAPFYLLVRKECLSYVQWYFNTVESHSLLYKLYKSRSRLSDFNHSIWSYSYRPRRSFLNCLRRIWARSRLGPWCAKPCQVSACLPLSIWCLASSPWRDATFTIGTVVGRPWAHCKRGFYSAEERFFP